MPDATPEEALPEARAAPAGWCNRPLEAVQFFRFLEGVVTGLTGARPRHDDERYEERYGLP